MGPRLTCSAKLWFSIWIMIFMWWSWCIHRADFTFLDYLSQVLNLTQFLMQPWQSSFGCLTWLLDLPVAFLDIKRWHGIVFSLWSICVVDSEALPRVFCLADSMHQLPLTTTRTCLTFTNVPLMCLPFAVMWVPKQWSKKFGACLRVPSAWREGSAASPFFFRWWP